MRAACAPGAEAETREEKRGPSGSGGRGRWRRGHRGGEHVPANPLGEADGPPRARARRRRGGGEGDGRPLPNLPRHHTRARAHGPPGRDIGACDGPDTFARLPSPLSSTGLDPPASRSPRRARIGSRRTPRRPAGRRRSGRPRGCGRRRRGSTETEGGRRGIGTATRAPSRGAAAARARPDLAGACGAKTLPDGAAGPAAGGEERDRGKARRRPARAPGPTHLPREGGRPRPLPNDTRSQPRDGRRAPLQATPARTSSLSGPTRTGRRRRRRRRGPLVRRPRRPRRTLATETRPQTRTGVSLPHVDPSRPARGARPGGPGASVPPTPRRLDLTKSSPPGTARGTEEAREWEEGAPADEGGSRAGTEEQGGKRGPEGKGACGCARDARGGTTAARPPPTTTPAHV